MPAINQGDFMFHTRIHRGHGPLLQQFIDGGLQGFNGFPSGLDKVA